MSNPTTKSKKKLHALNRLLKVYTGLGILLWVIATVLIFIPIFPFLWYRINAGATQSDLNTITAPTQGTTDNTFIKVLPGGSNTKTELPPQDTTLPKTNTLRIPTIGVNGTILEGTDADQILRKGIWRVNDFGTPEYKKTIILAAHRFGYVWWTTEFRTKNSFYNLPKTRVGDKVEIIWHQRKYTYEIYRAEDSTEIKDYGADLILYTCRMFNSPVRVFRYARRTN